MGTGVALVLDLISNINIHDVVLENTATLPGEKPSEDIGLTEYRYWYSNYTMLWIKQSRSKSKASTKCLSDCCLTPKRHIV
jgi:hypothetical protein